MIFRSVCVLIAAASLLAACGTTSDKPVMLACDGTINAAFRPDGHTTVVEVRQIAKGTALVAAGSRTPIVAAADMCLVKLLVGPGATAETDRSAKSYSEGIGIEVWLPAHSAWNERIRNHGGGGWAGGGHRYAGQIGSKLPAIVYANMGYVSATHDGGQPHGEDASFAFLADGRVNWESLRAMNSRAIDQQAIKARALADLYYGKPTRFSYYDGHSHGARQGLQLAQERPDLYDGYLIAQPAIDSARVALASLYPQVVMQADLGITAMDQPAAVDFARKVAAVNARAVASCDREKLGFLLDPFRCGYDPLRDEGALCTGAAGFGLSGTNREPATCMSAKEAVALNKIWYGPSVDGGYDPLQSTDGRSGRLLSNNHLWWGLSRGSSLSGVITRAAGTDVLALALRDVGYAADASVAPGIAITNTSTPLRNRWRELTPASYPQAFQRIGTDGLLRGERADNGDLTRFRNAGRKMIVWNGLADDVVPAQGAVAWYERLKDAAGGQAQVQQFLRMYNIPGMAHSSQGRAATVSGNDDAVPMPWLPGNANPAPTRERDTLFTALVDWVERGVPPGQILLSSRDGSVSYPVCVYPQRTTWMGTGDGRSAREYFCQ